MKPPAFLPSFRAILPIINLITTPTRHQLLSRAARHISLRIHPDQDCTPFCARPRTATPATHTACYAGSNIPATLFVSPSQVKNMSSTVSPASDGSRASEANKASATEANEDKTLRIDMAEEANSDIVYELVPVFGDPVRDEPFWHNLTSLSADLRGLGAMTAHYISAEEHNATPIPCRTDANKIREGVWRALEDLLPEHQPPDFLPSIIFNRAPLGCLGRRDIIDLVFPVSLSVASYNRILRSFKKLKIKGEAGKPQDYSLVGATNTLPGSMLALDCHGLLIEDLDPQSVFEALKVLVAPAGVLLGFAKVVLTSEKRGISGQYGGFIRGFVMLHQATLAVSFHKFIDLLPTHFKCNGVAYSLAYPGSKLHNRDIVSSNFSVTLAREGRANGSEKRGSAATDEGESSSAAKRQRRSEA